MKKENISTVMSAAIKTSESYSALRYDKQGIE